MRISDWSPDVCSSDLQALASAYLGPKPTGESPGIRIDAIGRSGIRRMEDMAGPLTTQPLPAIHDCDVHVHEREADLNAAGATNHLDGAREVLQCLEQLIEWFTFGPVRGSVVFHDCIDIETVITIGRASCRARVCQYVWSSATAGYLK